MSITRWIVYQRERFPLVSYVPLVAAFSGSAVCLSSLLRGHTGAPRAASFAVAFVTALCFFLQLRITDEFKDAEEDARFRPYRPVPRGLVTLAELRNVGVAAAAIQAALAVWLAAPLLWILAAAWAYLALMTREFFAPEWLRARPIVYLFSHMLIMPLIDLYATACDWRVVGLQSPPAGLIWFLFASFFNGIVIELGRKIRAHDDEEEGVDTYSRLWGPSVAVQAWLAAMLATATCAVQVSQHIGVDRPVAIILALLMAVCGAIAWRYVRADARGSGSGKLFEAASGVWTLVLYLSLGPAPLALAAWRS